MVKGRNTTVLGTRIPDRLFEAIEAVASMRGMTLSEYVRRVLEAQNQVQYEMAAKGQWPKGSELSGTELVDFQEN